MSNEKRLATRIVQKHDTQKNWDTTKAATTFIPMLGEIIIYEDNSSQMPYNFKIGDGKTSIKQLPFILDPAVEEALRKAKQSGAFKGDTGPQGPIGEQGPRGLTGEQGPKGNDGKSVTHSWDGYNLTLNSASGSTTTNLRGATGARGETGPQGNTGAAAGFGTPTASVVGGVGIPSVKVTASGSNTSKIFNFEFSNLKGATGAKGDDGIAGPIGPQGPAGKDGSNGARGPQGEPGKEGPVGKEGPRGATGERGPKGDPGMGFKIYKTYKSVSAMNADYPTSDEVPVGGFVIINTGNIMDVDNAKLYVKTDSKFEFIIDMSGATGIQGPRGEKGLTGETGPQGVRGPAGEQGPRGLQGVPGEKGATGDKGATGAQGVSITSVKQTSTSTADDGNNIITVTLSNGTTSTFTIQNGSKGSKGDQGETGNQGPKGSDGKSVTHSWSGSKLTLTSASGTTTTDLRGPQGNPGADGKNGATGPQGPAGKDGSNGAKGDRGLTGNGISSITKITNNTGSSEANTIRVTYTDKNYNDFTVYNGAKGATGDQGQKGDKGIDGGFSSKSVYPASTILRYVTNNTSWSSSEINEPKGEAWKPGNLIVLAIRCDNEDVYVSIQKVISESYLQPLTYWIEKRGAIGEQGPKGNNGTNGKDGKTPIKGQDYFTTQEVSNITNNAAINAAKKIKLIGNFSSNILKLNITI